MSGDSSTPVQGPGFPSEFTPPLLSLHFPPLDSGTLNHVERRKLSPKPVGKGGVLPLEVAAGGSSKGRTTRWGVRVHIGFGALVTPRFCHNSPFHHIDVCRFPGVAVDQPDDSDGLHLCCEWLDVRATYGGFRRGSASGPATEDPTLGDFLTSSGRRRRVADAGPERDDAPSPSGISPLHSIVAALGPTEAPHPCGTQPEWGALPWWSSFSKEARPTPLPPRVPSSARLGHVTHVLLL